MDTTQRIEAALEAAISDASGRGAPPKLKAALRHAVFPGGARVRPQLCISVAKACGDDSPLLSNAVAASIELIHCASLVHDDMPCFDDADLRRGKPTVHAQFGEPVALLAGDTLIVSAFETIAKAGLSSPRAAALVALVARAAGSPRGLCAGQAWESEPAADLKEYHCAKTGALFVAACMGGATAAGGNADDWRSLGEKLGEAYQVADDLMDAVADSEALGKSAGRDAALSRPSAVRSFGVRGAVQRLERLVEEAAASIPDCEGAGALRALVGLQAKRLAAVAPSVTAA